jgi:hypothetical protein
MAVTPAQSLRADLAFRGLPDENKEHLPYTSQCNDVVNAMIRHYADLMYLADRHGVDTSTLVSAGTYIYRKKLGDVDAEAAARTAATDEAAVAASNFNSAKTRVQRKRMELRQQATVSATKSAANPFAAEKACDDDGDLSAFFG